MKNTLKIFLASLVLFSCSSNNDDYLDDGLSFTNLTEGTYHLTGAIAETGFDLNNDGLLSNDLMTEFPECRKDDIIGFSKEGNYMMVEGKLICEGNNFILEEGTYELIKNYINIKLNTGDIKTLTNISIKKFSIGNQVHKRLKFRYYDEKLGTVINYTFETK